MLQFIPKVFTELFDVKLRSFVGFGGKLLRVSADETGVEVADTPIDLPRDSTIAGVPVGTFGGDIYGQGIFEGKKYRFIVIADDAGNEMPQLEEIV